MNAKMIKRIIFGSIMIAVTAGVLILEHVLGKSHPLSLYDRLPLTLVAIALLVPAFREVSRLVDGAGVKLLSVSGLLGAIVLGTSPYWVLHLAARLSVSYAVFNPLNLLLLVTLAIFAEQMLRHRIDDAIRRIACTVLAVVYLGATTAMILQIRGQFGVPTLVIFLAVVKCTDIGAYFTGSAIGKHKLIPWLSPGKTWEGLGGGLAAAAVVGLVLALIFGDAQSLLTPGRFACTWYKPMFFGLVVGLVGQFGDLCESLMKRSASVKDSGQLVPEFGGVLDVLDSPLLAAPVAYMLLNIM